MRGRHEEREMRERAERERDRRKRKKSERDDEMGSPESKRRGRQPGVEG